MTEAELLGIVQSGIEDSIHRSSQFLKENEKFLEYYLGMPFGDEELGRSQVVSTDVADVVEADMPSLARVFLGSGDVVEFKPTSGRPEDIEEAEQKNIYIPFLIRNCDDAFVKLHAFLKEIEISKVGVLEYGIRETKTVQQKHFSGISLEELTQYIMELEQDPRYTRIKIISQDEKQTPNGPEYTVDINCIKEGKDFYIENVPVEDLILSRNVASKNEAQVVGKKFRKTRGQLIAEGFDKETVKKLPKSKDSRNDSIKEDRYRAQGGSQSGSDQGENAGVDKGELHHWLNEYIEGEDLKVRVDFDGDDIAEIRHIVKVGDEILHNEFFGHINYAITSAMLMPHTMIGRSRAEIVCPTQRIQSVLYRQTLDNIYFVNNTRTAINDKVNMDDLLTVRFNGVVRTKEGNPAEHILPLLTPYVGDKSLQVIQYVDAKRVQSAGSLMANQALTSDHLHKETATRFEGIDDAAQAKVELVARVIAECGFKQLYEGFAWFASTYQDTAQEVYILGKELQVNPSSWRYDHRVEALVGTGAGDDQKSLQTLAIFRAIQSELHVAGSPLVDHKKVYNLLSRMLKMSGNYDIAKFFNDPEVPQQVLMAQVEMLGKAVQQLQAQVQQNPLAEAEMIRAQAKLVEAQGKGSNEMRKFVTEMAQKDKHFYAQLMADFAEMELKYGADLPGVGVESLGEVSNG